jgi:hypothetical protein
MTVRTRLLDPHRLQPIEDIREFLPGIDLSGKTDFTLRKNQDLLITDPTYLAHIYHPSRSVAAAYIRRHAAKAHGWSNQLWTCARILRGK